MTIDLDALDASIAESEKKNFFVAPIVKELIAELHELRSMRRADNEDIARAYDFARDKATALERAAVVAYLSECAQGGDTFGPRGSGDHLRLLATNIQRGWHRREEEEE